MKTALCIFLTAFFSLCRATEPFEFSSDGATAAIVSRAIGGHFGVTVFVAPDLADKKINGDLRGADLTKSLDVLAFGCGAMWRKTDGFYFVGGFDQSELISFPSAGLDDQAVRKAFGESATIVADRVVMRAPVSQRESILAVAAALGRRPLLKVRVSVVDTAATHQPAFYNFLQSMVVGVQKTGNALEGSVTMPCNVTVALDFLNQFTDTRMKLDTQLAVPSGGSLAISSGSVVERPIYLRADQSDQDLVTRYDRLQLGLTLEMRPFEHDGRWSLAYKVTDSDISSSGDEKQLSVDGTLDLVDGQAVKIASINREKESSVDKSVPGISKVPLIGRAFRSKGKATESRVVMVFVQRID